MKQRCGVPGATGRRGRGRDLPRSGSAVDAAITTAYAQAVVSPVMTSIAGTGVMNILLRPGTAKIAREPSVVGVDGKSTAVAAVNHLLLCSRTQGPLRLPRPGQIADL